MFLVLCYSVSIDCWIFQGDFVDRSIYVSVQEIQIFEYILS